MKKLQAAMRDSMAKKWRERRLYYRVGSVFKGCGNCGEFEVDEDDKVKFTSGFQVFRSYQPSAMGWTYWCWECGAKDELAWPNAWDIGQDAIRGTRDSIKAQRKLLRQTNLTNKVVAVPTRVSEIQALEDKLAALMAMLQKG